LQNVEFSLADGSALIKRWIPRNLTGEIILAALIAWAPLLIFTALKGVAFGTKVQIPFLADLVQYARFLVALPCTIALGKFINPRLQGVLNGFLRSGIVSGNDFTRYENAILRARALASSMVAELVIVTLVYLYISFGLYREVSPGVSSWNHSGGVTAAEWWFLWVSLPMLLFGAFLWVWRLGVWAYLLFRISKLELRVVATHPDGVGGLNFVNVGMRRFSLLIFAISSILCASIGEEILYKGASLHSYELEMALFFLVCLAVILGPLMVFTPALVRSKLEYWRTYGALSSRYVQGFDDKWISRTGYSSQELLGSPDIQSLADLRHSYAGIAEMRTLLPNRKTVGIFAFAYILPALPLLSTVISLRRIVSEVYALLLK
jgi:hypothetical protein